MLLLAMPWWGYLIIAIGIIIALLAIFFVSYYFEKKTPVPKGCENLFINEENCAACGNKDCSLRKEKSEEKEEEDK